MKLVTVDLDDTLIKTKRDYDESMTEFCEYVENQFGVDQETAMEVLSEIDRANAEKHGLSMERFPESFEMALEELAQSPSQEAREYVRQVANSTFKSPEDYAERGFRKGAKEVLDRLSSYADELHLVTAGDERVQNRKIEGLNLSRWFTDTHVVPMNTKSATIEQLVSSTGISEGKTYHIGNSEDSDVKAGIEAGVNVIYIPQAQWRKTTNTDYTTYDNVFVFNTFNEFRQTLPELVRMAPASD